MSSSGGVHISGSTVSATNQVIAERVSGVRLSSGGPAADPGELARRVRDLEDAVARYGPASADEAAVRERAAAVTREAAAEKPDGPTLRGLLTGITSAAGAATAIATAAGALMHLIP